MSPFLPGDYDDSCLPVALFDWRVRNLSARDLDVTLAFSFRDGWGKKERLRPRAEDVQDDVDGMMKARVIHQEFRSTSGSVINAHWHFV